MTDLMLVPADRARSARITGSRVQLGGAEWLLADALPDVCGGDVWDRIYDQNVLARQYKPDDLRLAGAKLLWANYELTADEGVGLILTAPPESLVAPVELALFGPQKPYRGYSEWVRASLIAAGINPKMVPPQDLLGVLDILVLTGKTVPQHQFVSAAAALTKRRDMFKKLRD